MNPGRTPKTTSVLPTLRVKIARRKKGAWIFKPAEPHCSRDACWYSKRDEVMDRNANFLWSTEYLKRRRSRNPININGSNGNGWNLAVHKH